MTKLLHLGNLANMAFDYNCILSQNNLAGQVLCYDLTFDTSNIKFSQFYTDKSLFSCYKSIKMSDYFSTLEPETEFELHWLQAIFRDSIKINTGHGYTFEELKKYHIYTKILSNIFKTNPPEITFCYSYAAIPMFIHAEIPYIPVDMGALRNSAHKNDEFTNILIHAYRNSPHFIITNPDIINDLEKIGLKHYTFIPHPVNTKLFTRNTVYNNINKGIIKGYEHVFFSATRHDWTVKGNEKLIIAFEKFIQAGYKAVLILIKWGNDYRQSLTLINKLGLQQEIIWIDLINEHILAEYINLADVVFDQFGETETLGLFSVKTMACGKPLVTTYNKTLHESIYTEHPPIHSANSVEEIYNWMIYFTNNRNNIEKIGNLNRQWIDKTHSFEVISKSFKGVVNLVNKGNTFVNFNLLKQKKLEISYESKYSSIYDSKYHTPVPYVIMDAYLAKYVKKYAELFPGPVKLLDLGCGPGSMIKPLLDTIPNIEIYGVDISPKMIDVAKSRFPQNEFIVGDADNIPYSNEMFDIVLCSGMLHHFHQLSPILGEIKRILKPDGYLIAREPNNMSFATHIPEIPLIHLCLKHFMNQLGDFAPIIEPEEHEFHKDFDYMNFPEELSKFFMVESLDCVLKVAYFYDMLTDSIYEEKLVKLEETLTGFPGLNMLVACRKSETIGINPKVKVTQKDYNSILSSRLSKSALTEHLKHLESFISTLVLAYSHPIFPKDIKLSPPSKISIINNSILLNGKQLTKNDYTELMFSLDKVKLLIDGTISSDILITALNLVKDYAPIELVLSKNSQVICSKAHSQIFTHIYHCLDGYFRRNALGLNVLKQVVLSLDINSSIKYTLPALFDLKSAYSVNINILSVINTKVEKHD